MGGVCLCERNSLFSLRFGASHKLGSVLRWIGVKDNGFLCNMYSRISAVPLMDDTDYSTSNCESNSESESNVLRENGHELSNFELFSAVVRVQKSLRWEVARKICFSRDVEKYGFDESLMAFKMLVHVYACAEMNDEVFALIRDVVCYYQRAELNLFGILYVLLDSLNDTEGLTFVVDVLIKVFASNKMLDNAVHAFVEARRIGLLPGIQACNFLLKCLAEANERAYIVELYNIMKDYGPFPSVYTYTIMMKFYFSGHVEADTEEAKAILGEMETIGISPSIVTYGTYILGCCRVGDIEIAWNYIQKLKLDGLQLNCYCFNAVIHSFVNRGRVDIAMQVFDEMKNCGIAADVYSYSILIEGFCRRGEVGEGLDLIEEMEKNQIKPSLVTYSSIMKALSKSGRVKSSFDLFQSIGKSGYEYDQHAYNILITGFCVQGNMDFANNLLEEMINNDLAPNSVSYNSLILGFCKSVDFEKALSFLNDLKEAGGVHDTLTCNHLINGYCNEGRIEEALNLIDEMRDQGVFPNGYTFSAIIIRLCKERKSEKALELIPRMLKSVKWNICPNVVICSILMDGFAKQGNTEKASIYAEKLRTGICPDSVALTIIINAYSNAGMVGNAYKVFELMVSRGLARDKITYTTMIAGFVRNNDMKAAWGLFKEMKERDISPSVVTYTCLIDGFCKINHMDMADKLVNEMILKGLCIDKVAYLVLVRSYLRRPDYADRGRVLFNEMKIRGMIPDETTS